jgi:hypothetical protein
MKVPNVLDTFKIDQSKVKAGLIGLEIEVEGSNFFTATKYWRSEHDGSLNNGMEYVFREPLDIPLVKKALTYFDYRAKICESKLVSSVRTGVHVHLNVQDLSMLELFNLITLYVLFEEVLTAYCGDSRDGNLFCLRCRDAESLVWAISQSIKTQDFSNLNHDNIRYSSLNLMSLWAYGSLEFRAMQTPEASKIYGGVFEWVNIVAKLKEACKLFKDPIGVIENFSGEDNLDFLSMVFGDMSGPLLNVPDCEEKIYSGMRNSQDIAYSCDWGLYKTEQVTNPFERPARPRYNWTTVEQDRTRQPDPFRNHR